MKALGELIGVDNLIAVADSAVSQLGCIICNSQSVNVLVHSCI